MLELWAAIQWALQNGVPGLLAVVCAAQSWVIYRQWQHINSLAQARVGDMKQFIDLGNRLHDKVHKTVSDLAKVADTVQRRRLP